MKIYLCIMPDGKYTAPDFSLTKPYEGGLPQRTVHVGQKVMLMHERYPTVFSVRDVFTSEDEESQVLVVQFNNSVVKNTADINYMVN